ncbi:MAG: sulfopyruvate decarboxylase subunit beta [Nitrospirae bacterium]|nr:sulfopyruvate decarboxylase subunit beta [Nitrospirota bacterium]
MLRPENELLDILKENGIDFIGTLPCDKIKNLCALIGRSFFHVPLAREEEGIGICAGAALAGRRPAMFVQSSGIGNMINALLSLTGFYKFPLALFVSRRGVYKEKIEAQVPMGQRLPRILKGAGISSTLIDSREDFRGIPGKLADIYSKNKIHVFMLNPVLWEAFEGSAGSAPVLNPPLAKDLTCRVSNKSKKPKPGLTRFEILDIIAPHLDSKVVVCNLGFPSKELYNVKHQPSNFYMLGSMGMATPIGLGIALTSKKDVIVIDGDGSILMNPGSLATAAYFEPKNLTIFVVDNGAYGSTGNQPTFASSCVDLELVAKGFGIKNTIKAASRKQLTEAMQYPHKGLTFIHALSVPGNKDVPNIPLHPLEIKQQVQDFLKS